MTEQHPAPPPNAAAAASTTADLLDEAAPVRPGAVPGDGEEPDLPDTPPSMADVTAWLHQAVWSVPYVDISQARWEEWGSIRMVAAAADRAALAVVLDDGQVIRLAPVQLTRPSGYAHRPFTLNPPGRQFTHASLDGAPLCERITDGEEVSADWAEVTCLDCQLAAPAPDQPGFDDLDHHTAEHQIRVVLGAASPQPLAIYDVMLRIDRQYRAIARTALARMAGQGTIIRIGDPDDTSPGWLLA